MLLITFLNIKQTVKQISEHIDQERINNAITEAEELDLSPVIGEQLYISIIEKKGIYADKYKDLMEGCIYQHNGEKYQLRGIKVALCYFAYARLIKGIDNNLSRSGFLQKDADYSIHAVIKERLAASNEAYAIGNTYALKCLDFINRNPESFPVVAKCKTKKINSQFRAIGD